MMCIDELGIYYEVSHNDPHVYVVHDCCLQPYILMVGCLLVIRGLCNAKYCATNNPKLTHYIIFAHTPI